MITSIEIDTLLHNKSKIIVDGIISSLVAPPQAIYLVGGYGRGEGAWYEDEKGIHPYNDFDVAVITDNPLSHEKTEILRKELAEAVDIKWVDIDFYSLGALKSFKPSIHNVDLLEGGKLIYGNDVIKENKLSLNKKEIGKQDLIVLYWTRMWTFLGSWEGGFHQLSVEEARFFRNQMAKAVLAACDMRLVKLHKYTTSYQERANRVIDEFESDSNLKELVEWAISEKMRPSSSELTDIQMESLYFRVKDYFVNSFIYAFEENSKYFLNPNITKYYYLLFTKEYLYHIYSLLRSGKSRIARKLDVYYSMNYVFYANNCGQINKDLLHKASSILYKQGYVNKIDNSWDELRILTANARNNI